MSNYFEELEKIANDITMVDDLAAEPMIPDYAPSVPPEEVEAVQANQPDIFDPEAGIEGQEPLSQEDMESYGDAIEQAQMQLESAKMTLAHTIEEYNAFDKTAQELNDVLPRMGAFAKLIEYSTSETIDDNLRKLASDRLVTAFESEGSFIEIMNKTANELFEDQEDVDALHSREGMEYVIERLALFAEDEELEKSAADLGGFVNDARKWAAETINAARNFHKLSDDIKQTQVEVDRLKSVMGEKVDALKKAKSLNDADMVSQLEPEAQKAMDDHTGMTGQLFEQKELRNRGGAALIGGATGIVGGSLFTGKKIADSFNNRDENQDENELAEKSASVTIKQDYVFDEGGKINMAESIVKDFLKIAGAAVLLDIANDEGTEEALRKQAAESFNSISRMGRKDMEDAFVKTATQLYSEERLHEIVTGKHNEELFSKVAFFTGINDLSVDELEKIAAAESVAAKGVGGALTDAKANIEAKVEGDKKKTETVANGEIGTKKADDMRGYNVINNPADYKVEKTAATVAMLEEAELRKEAAYKAFVEADTFIKNNAR